MRVKKEVLITGQVHGTIDWITKDRGEVGMFIKGRTGGSVRHVLRGQEIVALLSNNVLSKGMMLTAYGEVLARAFNRAKDAEIVGEVVMHTQKVIAEPATTRRVGGASYLTVKGVISSYDHKWEQIRMIINPTAVQKDAFGLTTSCLVNVPMGSWFKTLSLDKANTLRSLLVAGREFCAATSAEASAYVHREKGLTPILSLFPLGFRLQG